MKKIASNTFEKISLGAGVLLNRFTTVGEIVDADIAQIEEKRYETVLIEKGIPAEFGAYPDREQNGQGRHRYPHRPLYQGRIGPYPGDPDPVRVPRSGL